MNYEIDSYMEANRKMPGKDVVLQTKDSDYYLFKSDVLAGLITYSTDKNVAANLETITTERAHKIIEMNKKGEKPETLTENGNEKTVGKSVDLLEGDDISRFDGNKAKKKNGGKQKNNRNNKRRNQGQHKGADKNKQQPKNSPEKPAEA